MAYTTRSKAELPSAQEASVWIVYGFGQLSTCLYEWYCNNTAINIYSTNDKSN